jgi:hypothetical protein
MRPHPISTDLIWFAAVPPIKTARLAAGCAPVISIAVCVASHGRAPVTHLDQSKPASRGVRLHFVAIFNSVERTFLTLGRTTDSSGFQTNGLRATKQVGPCDAGPAGPSAFELPNCNPGNIQKALSSFMGFGGLSPDQLRGVMILHELRHVAGVSPPGHGDSRSNMEFTKEVATKCFGGT